MKLRTKIQLFSSLFMLILILLINTSVYFLFYKISAYSELEQLSAQTNTIVEALNSNPDIPKNELLFAFLPTNGMIRVIPEKGDEPIHVLTKQNEYRSLSGEFSSTESKAIITTKGNSNIAVISKPIIWENGQVVTLQVSDHLIALKETMTTLFYVLIVASIIMLIPTIIAGTILSRFLLQPIKALIDTMKENTKLEKWKKIDLKNRSHDELYEMEKTFNEMIDHLKENFEKQETFVSNASHELKTPISIVKSYAQLLERRGKDHPELFGESVQAIRSEADQMQELVEQMLLLAKSEEQSDHKEVIFNNLCEETVRTFKVAYNRKINFEKQYGSILVNGNEGQLRQIIYILIENALKYSEEDIKVNISKEDDWAVLRVIDFGQGIPKEEQKNIFDRFYRIDKSRSRGTGGTGLGLAIAKAIVETHHGNLFVTSNLGDGSTFTLKLPILIKD